MEKYIHKLNFDFLTNQRVIATKTSDTEVVTKICLVLAVFIYE